MGIVYWTPICTSLGIINFLVFIGQVYLAHIVPWENFHFPSENPLWYQYLTSLFLHGSWVHLTNNAFCLFVFGCSLEKKIGTFAFIIVYFISGIGGNILFQIFESNAYGIGASGAIFGIICSMAFTDPKAFVVTPGAPLPLPIILFAPLYIGNEFIALGGDTSNISHIAHIGGGIAGAFVGRWLSKYQS